jgi:hypothetical protein
MMLQAIKDFFTSLFKDTHHDEDEHALDSVADWSSEVQDNIRNTCEHEEQEK